MPHGLDHVVHVVHDLDTVADFYVRAGFAVGPRNRHPWGTHNRIVQLSNCYIELLEVAEPEKIVPHGLRSFSFGAFNRDFVARQEGLAMLLLNSRDAAGDAQAFEAAGIADYDVFSFEREGKTPDGTPVKLAFSLAFTSDPTSPEFSLAACQHHFPENFWNPACQVHANGVQHVSGVTMVANDPARHRDFLTACIGEAKVVCGPQGITARSENGDIDVLTPSAARDLFGFAVNSSGGGVRMQAVRFRVADLARVEALHRQNAVTARRRGDRLIVPPEQAFGATLIFDAAKP